MITETRKAFTDDDLERLKEYLGTVMEQYPVWLEIKNLIARLEAAENFMLADEGSDQQAFDAWRKAAGK
jgi:hypothetical protein